jgi:Carbohydrate binding module (family 6)/Right handed beta helix region
VVTTKTRIVAGTSAVAIATAVLAASPIAGTAAQAATTPAPRVVEAEDFDTQNGVRTEYTSDSGGGENIGWLAGGDWAAYTNVDLTNVDSIQLRLSSNATTSGYIDVRADGTSGPLLASVPVANSGGWDSWETVSEDLAGSATGTHRVALVFRSTAKSDFVNVNRFTLIGATSGGTTTPTPTPTPTPTAPAVTGSPGPSGPGRTVGVPAGVNLTPASGTTITTANTVIDAKDITGPVVVRAPGVVIKRSKIHSNGTGTGIYISGSGSVTVIDSDIYGFDDGVAGDNWTVRGTNIHAMSSDGVKLGSNVLLEQSWIHQLTPAAGSHGDGGQMQAGITNTVVRNNAIDVSSSGSNAALFLAPDLGPSSNGPLTVEGNYLDGGNYTVYCVDGNNGEYFVRNITIRNNTFGSHSKYGAKRTNVALTWTGNTWLTGGTIS